MRPRKSSLKIAVKAAAAALVAAGFFGAPSVNAACCRNYKEFADHCYAQGGVPSQNPLRCNERPAPRPDPGNAPTTSRPDDGAARRAQEAAAEAERQRQEEADGIERERLAEEKRKKDAEFIRDRNATARTLKGGTIGTAAAPNDGGLKGSSTLDTGLKELRGSDRVARDVQGPQAAWKQLHCAAALSGYAFAALSKPTQGKPAENFQDPDYQEFSFLANQALNALNGQALGVACPAAPPFPDLKGRAVDMDQVKEAEKKILNRALVIAERMKQRGDKPAASPGPAQAANETPDEKMRRVQRELNQANSRKITGKTQQEIDQQERDRKELARLILANNRLEKGELTSVSVEIPKDEARRAPRKPAPASQ
jgi:hypothetical protein